MNIAMLPFSITVLMTAFILHAQNIFSWPTDGSGWFSTDEKSGKQVPIGSVKEWTKVDWKPKWQLQFQGAVAISTPTFLISPGIFHLTSTPHSSVLQQSWVERFPIPKAAASTLSATFHETVGGRQPAGQSPHALLFWQVTDSQIFFRIQTAKTRALWVCHRWAKIDASGSFSSEPILY